MSTYVDIVKQAFLFFPVIALLFTLPYIVYNYHKYGSILSLRILIVYSFILYLICVYFLVILPLPSREQLDSESIHRSQEVSLLRRFTAMMLDLFFASVCTGVLEIFLNIFDFHQFSASLLFVLYFVVFPICRHGQTPGKQITHLRIASTERPEQDPLWYQYGIRSGSFVLLLFVFPFHAATLLYNPFASAALEILNLFFLLFLLIQAALHKPLFYEKWSHTKVVSTVPVPSASYFQIR